LTFLAWKGSERHEAEGIHRAPAERGEEEERAAGPRPGESARGGDEALQHLRARQQQAAQGHRQPARGARPVQRPLGAAEQSAEQRQAGHQRPHRAGHHHLQPARRGDQQNQRPQRAVRATLADRF
jgi:hypothetical protein